MRRSVVFALCFFISSIFSLSSFSAFAAGHSHGMGSDHKMPMKGDHMKGHHMNDGHMKKHGDHMMGKKRDEVPKDLNVATTKMSKNGMFKVSIASKLNPVAINKIHAWVLTVQKPDGSAVSDAKIEIGGGMPQHGHGFPTDPRVTKNLGDGKYLIEGVRFNMGGWWEMKATIGASMGKGDHSDKVTFNIVLN